MTLFFLTGTTGAGAILEGVLRGGSLRPYDNPLNIAGVELDGGTFPFVAQLPGEVVVTPVIEGGILESIPFLNSVTAVLEAVGWEVVWASQGPLDIAPEMLDSPDNLHRSDSTTHRAIFGRVDGAAVLLGGFVLNANATGGVADDVLAVGTTIFQNYRAFEDPLLDVSALLLGEVAVAGALRSPPMVMFDTTNFLERTVDDVSLSRVGAYTISVSLDPELIIPGNDGVVASKHNLTDTQAGWKIEYEVTAGLIRFTHYGAADGTISKSRTNLGGAAAVRVRSRVTFVIDGSGDITVYVNGSQSQDTQANVGVWVATNQSTEPFALGCDEPSNGGTNRYKGAIYDFTMWSTNISQAEAESLEPQGFLPGALTPNLVHYWDAFELRVSVTLGHFRDWIDSENSLALTPANPDASALPIYAAAADSGLNPTAPPLPFTHDNNALLFDQALPLPTTALTTLHRLDPLTKWRLWSANSLTPQVSGFFRKYRGDATITVVLARVDGANDIEICSIYGFRLQYASTSNVFLIDGDDAAPNNRIINFPGVSMPNGRSEPLEDVILNTVVKVFTIRYNSFTGEIDFYDGTIRVAHRVITTGQAANETRTNLLLSDFGDFRRMIFIPACLSGPQIESQLQKINPPGWFSGVEGEFGQKKPYGYMGSPYTPHAPRITPYRDLQGGGQGGAPLGTPISVGVVVEEPNPTFPTGTTTATGRLYYGDQRDGIVPSSVTIRMPQDGGPDMLYDDDGAGNLVAQIGAQPVSSSDIAYINEPAGGQVVLSGIPADGNTVEMIGVDQLVVTFEFESGGGVALGNIPVTIGVDTDTSATALRAAINANGFLRVTASGGAGTVQLTQFGGTTKKPVDGQLGNTVITVVGANLAKTDFAGGQRGGTWSLTITAGLTFDVAVLPTAVYEWDSQGLNAVGTPIVFDRLEFIITQNFLLDEGATLDSFYLDAPYVVKDGFDEGGPVGGGDIFTDPQPTVLTVTADATFIVNAIANAGPTNAGDVISWWEIELETNNEELILVADYFQPNTFSINRNHTDQFPILQGQNLDEKRIRFVIQAVADGAQFWKSLFFRMLGTEFDNAPATIIQVPVVGPGVDIGAGDLLTTEELAALVLNEGVVPDVFLAETQPENSRYKSTQVFRIRDTDRQGNELALMSVLPDFFQLGEDFNTYTVGARDIGFLDRVAVRFYGPGFEWAWWVIAYANAIIDVEQEMFSGQKLVIPTRTRLQSFLSKAAETTLTPD